MRLLIPIAALLLAAPASAADVSSRTSVSLLGQGSMGHGSFDAMLSERLRVRWSTDELEGEALFDGRIGVRAPDGTMHRTRIRALGVRLDLERVQVDVGRFRVEGGRWRLADGAQALVRLGAGVAVGGWFGEVPDPFTTLPAPRVGGGPLLRWEHERAQVSVAAEVAGTAAGLDRAAVVVAGRVEPVEKVELSGVIDVQDVAGAPHPADLGLTLTLDPSSDLRVRFFWNTWSGLAWNQGHLRDVALSRFEQRFGEDIPPDATAVDLSLYHQGGGSIRWSPELPAGGRFVLGGDGRYRGHDDPGRHHARATLRLGFEGLGGRVDVGTDHSAILWDGAWRWDGGVSVRVEVKRDVFALDTSARVTVGAEQPALYADLFADLHAGPVWISAGYRFVDEQQVDQWSAAHVGMLRVTWVLRHRGARRTP